EPIIVFREFATTQETTTGPDGKEVRHVKIIKDNLLSWRDLSGFSAPIAIPSELKMIDLTWGQDGTAIITFMARSQKPGTKPDVQKLALNLKNGKFAPLTQEPKLFSPLADTRPLRT